MNLNEGIGLQGMLEIFEKCEGETEWRLVRKEHNLIVNSGYTAIANRLTNLGSYTATTFTYFAWGDGTTTPALTDTAATFYADCANSDTKAVTSFDTFDSSNKIQIWNCFLAPGDNAVASITKFAIVNADPGTVMFSEIKFAAISKTALKQFYFRYSLTMSQV